jgi:hypothetical protein
MDKDNIYIDKMFCFTNMHSTHKHIYKSAITFWKEVWNEGKCYNIKRTTSACFWPWVAIYAFSAVYEIFNRSTYIDVWCALRTTITIEQCWQNSLIFRKYPSQSLRESKSIAQICTHKHISMQSVTLMHTPIRATEMGRPFSFFKYMIGHYFSNSIV